MARKKSIHYVNNADFSNAVVEYVEKVETARKTDNNIPSTQKTNTQPVIKIQQYPT